jgi:hypothetical protein
VRGQETGSDGGARVLKFVSLFRNADATGMVFGASRQDQSMRSRAMRGKHGSVIECGADARTSRQPTIGQGFVTRLMPDAQQLDWSTFFGDASLSSLSASMWTRMEGWSS